MHTGDEGCQSLIGSNLLTFLAKAARLWSIQVLSLGHCHLSTLSVILQRGRKPGRGRKCSSLWHPGFQPDWLFQVDTVIIRALGLSLFTPQTNSQESEHESRAHPTDAGRIPSRSESTVLGQATHRAGGLESARGPVVRQAGTLTFVSGGLKPGAQ